MSFKVLINPRVEEKIKDLPGANRERIRKLLDALQENPVPVEIFDIKKLKRLKNSSKFDGDVDYESAGSTYSFHMEIKPPTHHGIHDQ
jgi:hypothetical protein